MWNLVHLIKLRNPQISQNITGKGFWWIISQQQLWISYCPQIVNQKLPSVLSLFVLWRSSGNFRQNLGVKYSILFLKLSHYFLSKWVNPVVILLIKHRHRVKQHKCCINFFLIIKQVLKRNISVIHHICT